nr:unnamed protein product [Haemonchus contortus]
MERSFVKVTFLLAPPIVMSFAQKRNDANNVEDVSPVSRYFGSDNADPVTLADYRICREAIRAGIRSRHRLHLNRPVLSLDGSSTCSCSCVTRLRVAVPTAQQYAVAYPFMSDPIGDRG